VLLCRELDEAQSPEQENSLDGQQGMTNVLGGARLGQERIEQRAVVAPRWLHHIGGVPSHLGQRAAAGEIAQERFFGHDYFQTVDPDGHGITVYTSHVGELPV